MMLLKVLVLVGIIIPNDGPGHRFLELLQVLIVAPHVVVDRSRMLRPDSLLLR